MSEEIDDNERGKKTRTKPQYLKLNVTNLSFPSECPSMWNTIVGRNLQKKKKKNTYKTIIRIKRTAQKL